MGESTLSFYRKIIKGNKLREEYDKFKRPLQGNRVDRSKEYSEDEKVIYLHPFKEGGRDAIKNPASESYPVSFYDRVKKIILTGEKNTIEKIRNSYESRLHRKDGIAYLNYLYNDCTALIESYQKSPEDAKFKEHPVIIKSLKRVKGFLDRMIENSDSEESNQRDNSEIHKRDKQKLIQEFAENFKVDRRSKMSLEAIVKYLTLYERYKVEPNFDALIIERMDKLNLDYTSHGARSNMKDKWVKFRDIRTTD